MSSISFYQNQLDRFLEKYHVSNAEFMSVATGLWYPIILHVGRYSETQAVQDIYQRARRGIISTTDLLIASAPTPTSGDKIRYEGTDITTIDLVDPRIEVGATIGYDLMLRGN